MSLIIEKAIRNHHVISLILFFLLCFLETDSMYADPWGTDADLVCVVSRETMKSQQCSTPILGWFGEVMITFHQEIISPADGPRSHFIPSSSQYTLNAMREYGFFQGFSMGCDRLMRENEDPWVYRWTRDGAGKLIKYDPVPFLGKRPI